MKLELIKGCKMVNEEMYWAKKEVVCKTCHAPLRLLHLEINCNKTNECYQCLEECPLGTYYHEENECRSKFIIFLI